MPEHFVVPSSFICQAWSLQFEAVKEVVTVQVPVPEIEAVKVPVQPAWQIQLVLHV